MGGARARRAGGTVAVVVFASYAAACSFTSLAGLSDGSSDAGDDTAGFGIDSAVMPNPHDSGTPRVDSSSGVVDTGTGEDAADVTPPPAEAAPDDAGSDAGFCASLAPAPLFCDDFDEEDGGGLGVPPWDGVTQTGGSVVLSGGIVVSPPFAMLVTSQAEAPAIDLFGYKSFTSEPSTGTYTLSFELYVDQADTTTSSDSILAAIQLDDSHGTWDLQLEVNYDMTSGGLDVNLSENQRPGLDGAAKTYTANPTGATIPLGVWTAITMQATVGDSSSASITVGTTTTPVAITPSILGGYPEILVGDTFAVQSAEGWTLRYDNVTFDVQ